MMQDRRQARRRKVNRWLRRWMMLSVLASGLETTAQERQPPAAPQREEPVAVITALGAGLRLGVKPRSLTMALAVLRPSARQAASVISPLAAPAECDDCAAASGTKAASEAS